MTTREEIIAAAKEAGFTAYEIDITGSYIERLYAIAYEDGRQAELEECAKVCEDNACGGSAFNSAAKYMAKAIRARSTK